jgi:hypothetical protein
MKLVAMGIHKRMFLPALDTNAIVLSCYYISACRAEQAPFFFDALSDLGIGEAFPLLVRVLVKKMPMRQCELHYQTPSN